MSTAIEITNGDVATSATPDKTTDNAGEASIDTSKEVPMKQLYEQSTQYNHWRYTQSALAQLREKINLEVAANVRHSIDEERGLRMAQGLSLDDLPLDIKFLTVPDEQRLIEYYERSLVKIFRHWKLPSYVAATAIVYMKRFFLENTVMDYHPKDVMLTCMFLARKTENFLMTIDDFSKGLRSDAESILNLEFLVCKNLRFHFTVHHPYRPCLGFFYDMQAVTENIERLQKVYEAALKVIDKSLYTDLCFLYQPSQIALAAMRIACKEGSYDFERYATYKFKANETSTQNYNEILLPVLLDIENVLKEDPRCKEEENKEEEKSIKTVATEIDKRLKMCKDPAKNPDSLIYGKRKRAESNGDEDDDDDDKDDDRVEKRAKLDDDSSPE